MKFCVVINTIRRPLSLVQRSVAAALAQKPAADWVILIDQNPERLAFSAEITSDRRFQHLHHVVPAVSQARNSAPLPEEADWILFCDDDGYLAPDYTQKWMAHLQAQPELEILAGSILREDTGDFYTIRQKLGGDLRRFRSTKLLMGSNFSIRRNVFLELGKFDPRFGAGSAAGSSEETDFCWKAFFAGRRMAYFADLVVLHVPPFQENAEIAYQKSWRYGVGKGLLVKKWLFEQKRFLVLLELLEMFVVPFGQILIGLLQRNRPRLMAAVGSLQGRFRGFFWQKLELP